MIHEYALEPELVATWAASTEGKFYVRQFGISEGRLVSEYPKKWAKKVWDSFAMESDSDRMRLRELMILLQQNKIKRKHRDWRQDETWLDNAVQEHARHSFHAILARSNPAGKAEIIDANQPEYSPIWDCPNGLLVKRNVKEMVRAVRPMLKCCRWVKFIDPYICECKQSHGESLQAFLAEFSSDRPAGDPQFIEIHTKEGASSEHLRYFYEKIIPVGLTVSLYQWQEYEDSRRQSFHNRYILTDIGGVCFTHGLDTATPLHNGDTDNVFRLTQDQCALYDKHYREHSECFTFIGEQPLLMQGKH